jgi:hypothetical protein
VDDDCNGTVDEDYVSEATVCGAGSCQGTGQTACVMGAVVDSCGEGSPTGDDSVCNGSDDDCDGSVDEGYVTTPTTCGAGSCGGMGTLSCVGGTVVDSCQSGMPGSTADNVCNGIDDDCDGSTDEDYVSEVTTCGQGVCRASGATSCVNGAVLNSCAPGQPAAPTDETCDNTDNDCDGQIDDDFVGVPTSCGFGECEATGTTACEEGEVIDTCLVTCEGNCADGAEDDNDGLLDCEDPDCQNKPELWPQCAAGMVGSPCDSNADCTEGLTCETNFPGGYCYRACGAMGTCPPGSFCWAGAACVQGCVGEDGDACPRPEHVCEPLLTGGVTTPFCRPDCLQSCPAGTTCRPDTLQCM